MTYLGAAPTTTASRKSQTTYRYLCTAGQSVISGADLNNNVLSCDPLDTEIFMNGLKLDSTDTTITATQVTLAVPAAAGDEIEVVAYRTFESADHYDKSTSDTRYANVSGDTFTGDVRINGHLGINGEALDPTWANDTYGNTEVAIDGGGGYGVLHLRGDGAGSTNTRYSMGVGDGTFHMAYDDVASSHRILVNSSGHVTKPFQPSFKAHGTINAYSTTSPIVFDSTSQRGGHNVGNHYNTSNGVFTAPVAGRYLFHAHFGIARITAGTGYCYPNLTKNGASIMYTYLNAPTATMYSNVHLTQIVDLSVNDTVGVTFSYSNADYYNGHGELAFAGCLLG